MGRAARRLIVLCATQAAGPAGPAAPCAIRVRRCADAHPVTNSPDSSMRFSPDWVLSNIRARGQELFYPFAIFHRGIQTADTILEYLQIRCR